MLLIFIVLFHVIAQQAFNSKKNLFSHSNAVKQLMSMEIKTLHTMLPEYKGQKEDVNKKRPLFWTVFKNELSWFYLKGKKLYMGLYMPKSRLLFLRALSYKGW